MKKRSAGTEPPKACVVELGAGWRRWAERRSDAELEEIGSRLLQLAEAFGRPHIHAGLGVRRLQGNVFEFRISRGIRVVFLFFKPNRLHLVMSGSHDEVRSWLKSNV